MSPLAVLRAAALLLALCASSDAATYYVARNDTAASDSNPGSAPLPWLTIGRAISHSGLLPGDTIRVRAGIYRENVGGDTAFVRDGAEGSPITLQAEPGQRVVITGAAVITGWQPCTPASAKQNTNYANIYYVDLSWRPKALFQDETFLKMARTSAPGWWSVTAGSATPSSLTLVDSVNLTQPDDYWVDANVLWVEMTGGSQNRFVVAASSQTNHSITFASTWNHAPATPDLYCLSNMVKLISGPGQWTIEKIGSSPDLYRLFLWPLGGGSPDGRLIEGTRNNRFVIELAKTYPAPAPSWWVFDGLEICCGQNHGIGTWSSAGGHIIVQNCTFHHFGQQDEAYVPWGGCAIYGSGLPYCTYRRNVISQCYFGVVNVGASHVLIEENDIGPTGGDAVNATGSWKATDGTDLYSYDPARTPLYTTDVVVRRNYIHDNFDLAEHPDGIQSYAYIDGLIVQDNLVTNSGQSHMIEDSPNLIIRGNIIAGGDAYMLHTCQGNYGSPNTVIQGNTLWGGGWGLVSDSNQSHHYLNNIAVEANRGYCWSGFSTDFNPPSHANEVYTSDYNIFFHGGTIPLSQSPVSWNWTAHPFSQYVSVTGWDTHSRQENPLLANVPAYMLALSVTKLGCFTPTKVYVRDTENLSLVAVGDNIELDYDGVVRTVTGVGTTSDPWVTFTPGDDRIALNSRTLQDWRANSNFTLDFSLLPGSPARGGASDGGNLGSHVNSVQFARGDFNGDGLRDVPFWPLAAATLARWEVLAPHASHGELAAEAPDGYVEPRLAGVTKLRLTFDRPLDPATVTGPSALSITSTLHGDVSGQISQVILDSGNTTMLVLLSPKLPDAERYVLTLSGSVRAFGGRPVQGLTALHLGVLAGDADGSGRVTAADLLAIRQHAGQPLVSATAPYDISCDGAISGQDLLAARAFVSRALP